MALSAGIALGFPSTMITARSFSISAEQLRVNGRPGGYSLLAGRLIGSPEATEVTFASAARYQIFINLSMSARAGAKTIIN